jgi:hypothetical protein
VSITSREKQSLNRFGCILKENTGVFLVDWKGKREVHALSANIFACLACIQTIAGPIVLLVLEISQVRPLPHYFYFPFDLKSKTHRKWLSRLTSTGAVRLSLITGKRSCNRTHQLPPYLRLRASEIYAEALQQYESLEHDKYDFNHALQLMERHVRVPQLVHRVFLEDTLREMSERIEEAIKAVPSEDKARADDIVRMAAEAFGPYYRSNRKTLLDNLHAAQFGLTCIIDMHRMFVDNPKGITKFLSDTLAAALPRQQLDVLAELVAFVVAASKLPFKAPAEHKEQASTTALVPTIPELPAGLATLIQSIPASGISKDTASKFFDLIGLEVGGKPGRPTKDYSREYELKASGLSWGKVARRALEDNPEIREEFGGRTFQSLSFQERTNLTNRIREGARTYAERSGKPFPIGPEDVPD